MLPMGGTTAVTGLRANRWSRTTGSVRAHADEASHFVGWAKECPAKVVWVVYDQDLLPVVRDKEEAKGVSKPHHVYVKIRFGIHRAGETGDVPVPGLVYRVERGE